MPNDITIADVTAYVPYTTSCNLCKGTGNVMLTDSDGLELWKFARPCPVCRGVGQISTRKIPSMEEIESMMLHYF
jgi:DnaJ-class molecular chaperone